VGRQQDLVAEMSLRACSQVSLARRALGKLRRRCQEKKKRSAVAALIKESHSMLSASREHQKSPEQRVVRRVAGG